MLRYLMNNNTSVLAYDIDDCLYNEMEPLIAGDTRDEFLKYQLLRRIESFLALFLFLYFFV